MFKKTTIFVLLLLITLMGFSQQLPPKPATMVTDYTNTLSPADREQLENKLVAFNNATTTQIAVVLIKSTGQYEINDYAVQLGRAWGVGQKDKNNGIVVLVAKDDRKVSIQIGYGVEGAVPDITANAIIKNDITPRFKAGDYYGGLDSATTDLIKYTKGEYTAPKKDNADNNDDAGGGIFIVIIIVIVVLIIVFRSRGGGGGGQIYGGRGGASPFWWFLGGSLLGRGSSGWGGGSSGGGSSGGGGFGGFGGGSFGGGGSSGSW